MDSRDRLVHGETGGQGSLTKANTRGFYKSTVRRKCALNILRGWVTFPIVGRAFLETTMVCHQVRAGVGHSLCPQVQNHLLCTKPHDPPEAQNWALLSTDLILYGAKITGLAAL